MPESIIQKKQRIFGNVPDGSPAAVQAVASGQWTPQDARDLRKHLGNQAGAVKTKLTHSDRVALTMKGRNSV